MGVQRFKAFCEWLPFPEPSCASSLLSSSFITTCFTASWRKTDSLWCVIHGPSFSHWECWAVKPPRILLIQHDTAVVSKWNSQCTAVVDKWDKWELFYRPGTISLYVLMNSFLCIHLLTNHSIWMIFPNMSTTCDLDQCACFKYRFFLNSLFFSGGDDQEERQRCSCLRLSL